jgi:hypothetical protein
MLMTDFQVSLESIQPPAASARVRGGFYAAVELLRGRKRASAHASASAGSKISRVPHFPIGRGPLSMHGFVHCASVASAIGKPFSRRNGPSCGSVNRGG